MASTNPKTYESTAPRKLAFLGLGVMGFPMAGHLALAGHHVTVYNRSAAKAETWKKEFKGHSGATPALAAGDAEIVFCCVGNDDDLRSVTLGEAAGDGAGRPVLRRRAGRRRQALGHLQPDHPAESARPRSIMASC